MDAERQKFEEWWAAHCRNAHMQPRFDFNNVTLNYSNEVTRRRWEAWAASAEVRPARKADPIVVASLAILNNDLGKLLEDLDICRVFADHRQYELLSTWVDKLRGLQAHVTKLSGYSRQQVTKESEAAEVAATEPTPEKQAEMINPGEAEVGKFYISNSHGRVFCCTNGGEEYLPAFACKSMSGSTVLRFLKDDPLVLSQEQRWLD